MYSPREIRPPNPRSKATVCALGRGNIAERAATAFVALRVVFAVDSNNRIRRRNLVVAKRAGVEPTVRFAALAAIEGTKAHRSTLRQSVLLALISYFTTHRIDVYRLFCALYFMA
jgi:hypothetical protein